VLGAGTVINPIIKVITTVAILGAAYLFIVKPVLDTTETVSEGFNNSISQGFSQPQREAEQRLKAAGIRTTKAKRITSHAKGDATRLLNCIQAAGGDVNEIQACGARFGS